MMSWTVRDANNVKVKGGTRHKIQSDTNSAEYSTSFGIPAAGVYTVVATSGAPNSQTTSCQGSASATFSVKDKPSANVRAATSQIGHLPVTAVQAPTLTTIKQVPYTDQGGETWIAVQGTGNCKFSIARDGGAAIDYNVANPQALPMKIKIVGAPTGSHSWAAKGTGNCTGTANTTFTVNK